MKGALVGFGQVAEIHPALAGPVPVRAARRAQPEHARMRRVLDVLRRRVRRREDLDSIAAGESLVRPVIFLPRPRPIWRLTSALTGLPKVPSVAHLWT